MKPVNSMADYYYKVKIDAGYKQFAIGVYNTFGPPHRACYSHSYEDAIQWIENWIKSEKKRNYEDFNCRTIVHVLNNHNPDRKYDATY